MGRRAALATGSREFFGEWKMSYGETYCTPPPRPLATRTWHLTPSCVYIRPWKWEIVMSHSGCVFTLRSHARKEISHGLLKVARWERIAAVPPELQWFSSESQNLFHVIAAAKTSDKQKNSNISDTAECCRGKGNRGVRTRGKNWYKQEKLLREIV